MDNVEIERNDATGTFFTALGVIVGVFALIMMFGLSFSRIHLNH